MIENATVKCTSKTEATKCIKWNFRFFSLIIIIIRGEPNPPTDQICLHVIPHSTSNNSNKTTKLYYRHHIFFLHLFFNKICIL